MPEDSAYGDQLASLKEPGGLGVLRDQDADDWLKEHAPVGDGAYAEQLANLKNPERPYVLLQQKQKEAAEKYEQRPLSEQAGEFAVRRSLPFASSYFGFAEKLNYKQANDRFQSGEASDSDIEQIAKYQQVQKHEAEKSTGAAALGAIGHIPAILGEAAVAGGAVRGGAAAGLRLFGREAAVTAGEVAAGWTLRGTAAAAPGWIGRTAAQTALMPSMYLPQSADRAIQNGTDWYKLENLGPAYAIGSMQVGLLGGISQGPAVLAKAAPASLAGRALSGGSLGAWAARLFAGTATGMSGQEAIDTGAHLAGWKSDWGTMTELVNGKDQSLKHAIVQASVFAVFSALHAHVDPNAASAAKTRIEAMDRIMQSTTDYLDRMADDGYSRNEAGQEALKVHLELGKQIRDGNFSGRLPQDLSDAGKAYAEKLASQMADPVQTAQEAAQNAPKGPISPEAPPATEPGKAPEPTPGALEPHLEGLAQRAARGEIRPPDVLEAIKDLPPEERQATFQKIEQRASQLNPDWAAPKAPMSRTVPGAQKPAPKEPTTLEDLGAKYGIAREAPKAPDIPGAKSFQDAFPEAKPTASGKLYVRAGDTDLFAEKGEGENSVRIDFTRPGQSAEELATTNRGRMAQGLKPLEAGIGATLQPGTMAFLRGLNKLVNGLKSEGVNVEYTAKGAQRAELYEKALTKAGFEQVSGPKGDEVGLRTWRPAKAGGGEPPESGMVVANRGKDGKVYYGKPGDTHADLSLRYPGKFEGQPDSSFGFAGKDGKYLTRDEASRATEGQVPRSLTATHPSGFLGSTELNRAQESKPVEPSTTLPARSRLQDAAKAFIDKGGKEVDLSAIRIQLEEMTPEEFYKLGWYPKTPELVKYVEAAEEARDQALARSTPKPAPTELATTPVEQRPTGRTIPKEGFVHGAPVETIPKYLKTGIPLYSTDQGHRLGFVGRLDSPAGYEGSVTAVSGFGPRTSRSAQYEKTTGIGLERQRESVAFILSPEVKALPSRAWDAIHEFVSNHPKMQELWEGKDRVSHEESAAVLREIRPELEKFIKDRGLDKFSKSHSFDPEGVVGPELADQTAKPEQITGIVYDGPLPKIKSLMQQAGRSVDVFGSDGNLRLPAQKGELTAPSESAKPAVITPDEFNAKLRDADLTPRERLVVQKLLDGATHRAILDDPDFKGLYNKTGEKAPDKPGSVAYLESKALEKMGVEHGSVVQWQRANAEAEGRKVPKGSKFPTVLVEPEIAERMANADLPKLSTDPEVQRTLGLTEEQIQDGNIIEQQLQNRAPTQEEMNAIDHIKRIARDHGIDEASVRRRIDESVQAAEESARAAFEAKGTAPEQAAPAEGAAEAGRPGPGAAETAAPDALRGEAARGELSQSARMKERIAAAKAKMSAPPVVGGGQPKTSGLRPGEQALAFEEVDAKRDQLGLNPLMKDMVRADPEVWAKVQKTVADDPSAPERLVAELNQRPRPASLDEMALLLYRKVQLQNAHAEATDAFNEAYAKNKGPSEESRAAAAKERQIADLIDKTDKAAQHPAAEAGRILRWQRQIANEDYTLLGLLRRATTAKGEPLTEAEEAKMDEMANRIKDLESQLATNPNARPIQTKLGRAKDFVDSFFLQQAWLRKPWNEKLQDLYGAFRRAMVLSSPIVVAKLNSAAATRMIANMPEEALGGLYGRLAPGLGKAAMMERGSFDAMARGWAALFSQQALTDAVETLKTGKSDLDIEHGETRPLSRPILEFAQRVHGALKAPVKRAFYESGLVKGAKWALDNGLDPNDPTVATRIGLEAYKYANRSIFMQDNMVSDAVNRAIARLERPDPVTGKVNPVGKFGATVGRHFLPVVKVPTNIVGETLLSLTGLPRGLTGLSRAYLNGIENLTPEQADIIMRQLKKGSLGGAMLAVGFLLPDNFGGYHQPNEKRKEGEPEMGGAKVGSVEVPRYLLHNPLLEAAQVGATVRKVADSMTGPRGHKTAQGYGWGLFRAITGLFEEAPMVREAVDVGNLYGPNASVQREVGQQVKSAVVPAGVGWMARNIDRDESGKKIERSSKTVKEEVQSAVPFWRQGLNKKIK